MKTELLSDFRRDISRAYGVLNEERFYSNRAYFLIDREGRVRWSHVEGNNGEPGRYSFTAPLPQASVTVGVTKIEGRSNKITVIQQPSAGNDFTAIVEIHDDGGGAREYLLEIFWK